ncbi:MAG: 4'-phosphopantetheinyl transferase family protein [Gemmatimonadales bacterium]
MTEPGAVSALWSAPARLPNLRAGEIHVFAFPLHAPAARLAELKNLLSRDEAERAAGYLQAGDRVRYQVGRAMLRTILGRYLDLDAHELAFVYGSHGKPALQDRGGQEHLNFNLARSGELAVLTLQLDGDIGIDLERVRQFPNALDIGKRFFAPQEHDALCSLPAAGLDAAFFSYWTRKEAVVKSIGLGLSQPMDAFALGLHPGAGGEQVIVQDTPCWVVPLPPPSGAYVAALATLGPPRPLNCWTWRDPPTPTQ